MIGYYYREYAAIFVAAYVFAAFGLAFILGHSAITAGARSFVYGGIPHTMHTAPSAQLVLRRWLLALIECPGCLGFWTGLVFGLATGVGFKWACALALFTSGTNTFLALFSGLINREQ